MESYRKEIEIRQKDVCDILGKVTEKSGIEIMEENFADDTVEQYAIIKLSQFNFSLDAFDYQKNIEEIKSLLNNRKSN